MGCGTFHRKTGIEVEAQFYSLSKRKKELDMKREVWAQNEVRSGVNKYL
jgi:hypothetical protein